MRGRRRSARSWARSSFPSARFCGFTNSRTPWRWRSPSPSCSETSPIPSQSGIGGNSGCAPADPPSKNQSIPAPRIFSLFSSDLFLSLSSTAIAAAAPHFGPLSRRAADFQRTVSGSLDLGDGPARLLRRRPRLILPLPAPVCTRRASAPGPAPRCAPGPSGPAASERECCMEAPRVHPRWSRRT